MSAIVRGAVSGQGAPLRGRRVAVVTWSPRSSTSMLLGQAFTDRNGRFEIGYDERAGQGRLAVCVVDPSGRILAASRELSTLPPGADVDLDVPATEPDMEATRAMSLTELQADDDGQGQGQGGGQGQQGGGQGGQIQQGSGGTLPPPTTVDCDYTVTGHITWSDGSPVAGVAVRAVDQDLRGEQPLGPYAPDFHQETLTDESGEYTIQYHREQYTRAEYGTADLVVRVG